MSDELKKKLENEDLCYAEVILDSFNFKRLENAKTEELFLLLEE